jgi:hypothetical protein
MQQQQFRPNYLQACYRLSRFELTAGSAMNGL